MKIIEPSVELCKQYNPIDHVAQCARICYRSEAKDKDSNEKLYNALQSSGHWSMFRHESVYAIIPINKINIFNHTIDELLLWYSNCPYIEIHKDEKYIYIATNMNFIMDTSDRVLTKLIMKYRVNEQEFGLYSDITFNMLRYTFKVTTQISTSRELNRVSPNNIAEQSTRYVYDDGTLCRPHWINEYNIKNYYNSNPMYDKSFSYLKSCDLQFDIYKDLVDNGLYKQDARGVLPLDTATVCVYSYSIREWRHIIDLRYYGTTGKPHPNAKIIAGMIREKLIEEGYEFKNK